LLKEVQPPVRNTGACFGAAGDGDGGSNGDDVFCQPPDDNDIGGSGSGGTLDDGGGGDGGGGGSFDGGGGGVAEPVIVAHPDRLNPDDDGVETDAQPPGFFGGSFGAIGSATTRVGEASGATPVLPTAGFGILMPLAAAILRSSFSSRLRSFSLRLSISSFGTIRALACMSFKRAL
jgi:hypothetical protein